MRTLLSYVVAATVVLLSCGPALADDKQLQNQKGDVSYQKSSGKPKALAKDASIVLADKDYAITGSESLAAVGLPDSSRVLVGSDTKVQLAFFNQVAGNNARFVVYNGKVRFTVQHPAGATANYTFVTPTATVGVRGTQGDIDSASDTTRVNVYEVCDPATPVTVTTKDGKQYEVKQGESLVTQVIGGVVKARIEALTQQMIDQFSPDFGVPTSWDAAKGQIVGMASGKVDQVTGGYGSQIIGSILSHKPKATPTPQSASCSHATASPTPQ
jgi:hypothetical protein